MLRSVLRVCAASGRRRSNAAAALALRRFAISPVAVCKHTSAAITALHAQLMYLDNTAAPNALSASPTAPHERDCRFEELLRDAIKSSAGDAALPWRVYSSFRKLGKPTAWAYRQMLVYCLDAADMKRFDEVRANMTADRVKLDVAVVNVLLARCLLHKLPVKPVLDEAAAHGVGADRDTYLLLLQAYAGDGLVHRCLHVLHQIAANALPLERDDDVFRLIAQAARNSDNTADAISHAVDATRKLGFHDVTWHQFGLPKRLLQRIERR